MVPMIGPSLPNLLATVAGNLSELKQFSGLKLLDITLPPAFLTRYQGPQFGVAGTRAATGVHDRPIIGTIIYLVLQQTLASYNAWYLIILGLVAVLVALFARRGLWGLVDDHLNVRLFPVGYWLRFAGEGRRGEALSSPSRRARGVAPPS